MFDPLMRPVSVCPFPCETCRIHDCLLSESISHGPRRAPCARACILPGVWFLALSLSHGKKVGAEEAPSPSASRGTSGAATPASSSGQAYSLTTVLPLAGVNIRSGKVDGNDNSLKITR